MNKVSCLNMFSNKAKKKKCSNLKDFRVYGVHVVFISIIYRDIFLFLVVVVGGFVVIII